MMTNEELESVIALVSEILLSDTALKKITSLLGGDTEFTPEKIATAKKLHELIAAHMMKYHVIFETVPECLEYYSDLLRMLQSGIELANEEK